MLYDALLFGLVMFLTILMPFISVYCFMRGYAMGVKDWNITRPDEPKKDPTKKAKTINHATDEKLKMYANLLDNIENYDGTGANQKEIN